MLKRATTLLALLLVPFAAWAQDCDTVRDIQAIPQDNVQQLQDLGAAVTESQITDLIFNDCVGEQVTFTAVVLSDPTQSGLSTPDTETGLPSRIHVFVRDVAAVEEGLAGMTIQLVDGNYEDTRLLYDYGFGDVITVTGEVAPWGTVMQVNPSDISPELAYQYPDSLLDPVTISVDEANQPTADGVRVNWANLEDLRDQYVRVENALITNIDITSDRPNWLFTDEGGEGFLHSYDISIRFRNDRDNAADVFDVREDDFVPPPPGTVANVQGFLVFNGFDAFGVSDPEGVLLSIAPFDEEYDLEILVSAPIVQNLTQPDYVPGAAPVTVSADVAADASRELANVELVYTTSGSTDEQTLAPVSVDGATYTWEIPAQGDGEFVTYFVRATDNEGATSELPRDGLTYRVLLDGIDEISDIQLTADEAPGDSPFTGLTVGGDTLNLNVTVQSQPDASGLIAVQDDADLTPWSGIFIESTSELVANLSQGDQLTIHRATIVEDFNVTTLVVGEGDYEVTGSDDFLGYKTVPTGVLTDPALAEAHEGMALRFEDVVITAPNADGDCSEGSTNFGEWAFSSTGDAADAIRADDVSPAFTADFGCATFEEGDEIGAIQGIWYYSFGNYKLLPESEDDIIMVVSTETAMLGDQALRANQPNPFAASTDITFELAEAGEMTLEVFDTLGRRVAVLAEGFQPAGEQTVTFEADGLPSGLYLYRLTAGEQQSSRRMLLVK